MIPQLLNYLTYGHVGPTYIGSSSLDRGNLFPLRYIGFIHFWAAI